MSHSDVKDAEIFEQSQKIKALEDACQDLEGTIVQFRELVLSLQRYTSPSIYLSWLNLSPL